MEIPPIVIAAVTSSKLFIWLVGVVPTATDCLGKNILVDLAFGGCPSVDELQCRAGANHTDNEAEGDEARIERSWYYLPMPLCKEGIGICCGRGHDIGLVRKQQKHY